MLSLCLTMLDTAKEKDKFEELYNSYKKFVYYIAFEYMAENSLAEDATQETFLKLTKYINNIESIDSPKTLSFIKIVTQSVCLDMLKKEKYYRINTEKFHKEHTNNTEEVYIILDKIRELPEIYRDILILRYYLDIPTKKIADIYNITYNCARKRLQRAKKLIKEVKI